MYGDFCFQIPCYYCYYGFQYFSLRPGAPLVLTVPSATRTVPGAPNCEFLLFFPDFLGDFKSRELPRTRGFEIQYFLKMQYPWVTTSHSLTNSLMVS